MKNTLLILVTLLFTNVIQSQPWLQRASIPGSGRDAANSFVINGKVYLGGGSLSGGSAANDYYSYDPTTNTWTTIASLPDYIGGSATFVLNGKGYVVSGQNNSGVVNSVYQYDPVLNQWNTMSNFPGAARLDCMGFSIGDTGYIFGGYPGGTELNDLWAYNPGDDSWTQKASMPSFGRSGPGGFVINGIAYIGLGEYNSSSNYAPDMFSYNPITNTWDSISRFPGFVRNNPLSFTSGGYGYLGMGNYYNTTSGVDSLFTNFYQYNPQSNSWTQSINFSSAGRGNAVCAQIGDTIFVGSGVGSGSNYLVDWWQNTDYPTAIKTVDLSKTSVFPNPLINGSWTLIVGDDLIGCSVEILDDRGQQIYHSIVASAKSEISINASSGLYIMRISSLTNNSVLKLVKL